MRSAAEDAASPLAGGRRRHGYVRNPCRGMNGCLEAILGLRKVLKFRPPPPISSTVPKAAA